MPYKRKITKTKKRTTRTFNKKRKSAIRRRISYRKGKNWWSKYKKGYKFKKKDERLLKFTTKASIPELMEWMYPLAAKLIEAAAVNVKRMIKQVLLFLIITLMNYVVLLCRCLWLMMIDQYIT